MADNPALAIDFVRPGNGEYVPLVPPENTAESSASDGLDDLDQVFSIMSKIMIVDDETFNHQVVERYLYNTGYRYFVTISDSTKAMNKIRQERPDLILLDIMMPEVSGIDILRALRADQNLKQTPVIILTATSDLELKREALRLRVSDFLNKPVDPNDLIPRVRNALIVKAHQDHLAIHAKDLEEKVQQRTAELAASRQEVILCLARAAEFRDNETGNHVVRVGRYVGIIAREMGFSDEKVEMLEQAAQLHDVGKIGIPDSILLKPGKLDPDEFEQVQKHCSYGRKIIQRLPEPEWDALKRHTDLGAKLLEIVRTPIIELASKIALTHHERWDGTGYPLGLAGDDIPIEGRMTAVADVFDALSTKRPYKPAFPSKKCFQIMEDSRGTQFDSKILDAFFRCRKDIANVQIACADAE
jgi:putative two-component system response regulator